MLAVSARIKADICTDWMHGTGCVKTRLQSDPCDFVRGGWMFPTGTLPRTV